MGVWLSANICAETQQHFCWSTDINRGTIARKLFKASASHSNRVNANVLVTRKKQMLKKNHFFSRNRPSDEHLCLRAETRQTALPAWIESFTWTSPRRKFARRFCANWIWRSPPTCPWMPFPSIWSSSFWTDTGMTSRTRSTSWMMIRLHISMAEATATLLLMRRTTITSRPDRSTCWRKIVSSSTYLIMIFASWARFAKIKFAQKFLWCPTFTKLAFCKLVVSLFWVITTILFAKNGKLELNPDLAPWGSWSLNHYFRAS